MAIDEAVSRGRQWNCQPDNDGYLPQLASPASDLPEKFATLFALSSTLSGECKCSPR
jgi:hypothetical protein